MPCGCCHFSVLALPSQPLCCPPAQYRNANNPVAHYDSTAEEILQQCDGAYFHPDPSVHFTAPPWLPGSMHVTHPSLVSSCSSF